MKKRLVMVGILAVMLISSALGAVGDLVGSVSFEVPCASGVGVGIAFDGENLWYSCGFTSGTNLYKADPLDGDVLASYTINTTGGEGLGALAYDAGRNAIWAGWSGETGEVILINLSGAKEVDNYATAFFAPEAINFDLDDGLAYDASDDTLYISGDVDTEIHHYTSAGVHLGSFLKAPGSTCGNSGLAIGGDLLYEGFNGCNQVIVVDKSATGTPVYSFSTAVGSDPGFRDEDLECDTTTFAKEGKHVMWSVEAYDPRRAMAFEIPFGTCGEGGKPPETPPGDVPEFTLPGIISAAGLLTLFAVSKRRD